MVHPDDHAPADDADPVSVPEGVGRAEGDDVDLDAERVVDEPVVDQPAVVRRHAKMGTFIGLGLVVGLLLSVILTFAIPDDPGFVPANPDLQFSDLQVFAFLVIFLCPLMIGVFGFVGYIAGNVVGRRSRDVVLHREASGGTDAATGEATDGR